MPSTVDSYRSSSKRSSPLLCAFLPTIHSSPLLSRLYKFWAARMKQCMAEVTGKATVEWWTKREGEDGVGMGGVVRRVVVCFRSSKASGEEQDCNE
jgi:hypothetical protein